MNKDNLWYIILLPVIVIILFILSAIGMSDTQFTQFQNVQTEPVPVPVGGVAPTTSP